LDGFAKPISDSQNDCIKLPSLKPVSVWLRQIENAQSVVPVKLAKHVTGYTQCAVRFQLANQAIIANTIFFGAFCG